MKYFLFLCSVGVLISGCSVLGTVPEVSNHLHLVANNYDIQKCDKYTSNASVQISTVDSASLFNTQEMYYQYHNSSEIKHYKFNHWANFPNAMLSTDLTKYIISSCMFAKATDPIAVVISADYKMVVYVINMTHIINGKKSVVNIDIIANIVKNKTNSVLFTRLYQYNESVVSNDANGMSIATNSVFAKFDKDVIRDMLRVID